MASLISHPAVPLALGLALGSGVVSPRLLAAGMFASLLPDLDVLGFKAGIAYADPLGHRGASHSIVAAILIGLAASAGATHLRTSAIRAFLFVYVATLSHGLLDMLTNGGLGIGLGWPVSSDRLFFPAHPIQVSPLGLSRFFGPAGVKVLLSELVWIWLPAFGFTVCVASLRRWREKRSLPAAP